MAQWRVDPARLIRPYTHSARVMSCTPPTHTVLSLTQERRNGKQERESTGESEKNVVQERGNAKGKSRNAGTRECKGTQERAPISAYIYHKLCTVHEKVRLYGVI